VEVAGPVIEIDGSYGEGGGQLVRTGIALATLLGKEIQISNIRARRPKPGLKAQHFAGVKALATISEAEVSGLEIGSTKLTFKPRTRLQGAFSFDVGTAGSISLVLQAVMPAAAYLPKPMKFEVTGGTDVKWSPTIDYVRFVVLPNLEMMGYKATLEVHRRGHYPKGGGKITMLIQPTGKLRSLSLRERSEPQRISGLSHCVRLPSHVAERQAKAAEAYLRGSGYSDVKVQVENYAPDKDFHVGSGSGLALFCRLSSGSVVGADALGERGKPAESVGREAAGKLTKELSSEMPLDRHMADILIPYMAVAEGFSDIATSEITMHTLTNIWVAEQLVDVKFNVTGEPGKAGRISVEGAGLGA